MSTKQPSPKRRPDRSPEGHILCGTDFSVHATEAASVAAAIAGRLRIPLRLMHVLDESVGTGTPSPFGAPWRESAESGLAGEVTRLAGRDLVVRPELMSGRPEAELVRAATRPGGRLMVTASLGQIAVSRLLIGSVAERTAEASPIPTLVVREAKPLIEWAGGNRVLRVLVAADFSASAESAIRWLKELRLIGPCELILGYVSWPEAERRRLGSHAPTAGTQLPAEVERTIVRDWHARLKTLLGDTDARVRVVSSWGAPAYNLIQLAQEEQVDLIVVGTHQRHGLSRLTHTSVSRAVLHHSPTNVVCVPAAFGASPSAAAIPEFHHVLVTTDFSERANHAIPFAYAGLSRGGTVRLVHVLPPVSPMEVDRFRLEKARAKLLTELTGKLRALVPQESIERGVRTEAFVREGGDAAITICQEAERFGADLICLGSHGQTGLAAALFGSVAQKVVADSTRPVLIIRMPPG